MDALEKFVEESGVPIVTLFNNDPTNHPFVLKFFNSPNAKVNMITLTLFLLFIKFDFVCDKNWEFHNYVFYEFTVIVARSILFIYLYNHK